MAIRNIIKLGDPILREVSSQVKSFDKSLSNLIDDMFETMEYENGVGLAAVQVGILRRICVICADEQRYELVNPKIISQEGSQFFTEGCLSVPQKQGLVKRPKRLVVTAFDRHGKEFSIDAEDYLAVVLCHEIDHMDGIVFVDKAEKITT